MGIIKIGIITTIRKRHDFLEYCLDPRIISFIEKIFNKTNIKIINSSNQIKNLDYVISIGGNDLLSKKIEDLKRLKLNNECIEKCIKYNKQYLGICYGAQILFKYFKGNLVKSNLHVKKKHNIIFKKRKYKVNSFHNYVIKKISKNFIPLAISQIDGSIEYFKHKKYNFFGIMWHPERDKKSLNNSLKILKKNQ